MDTIPYRQRCWVHTPDTFRQGVFRERQDPRVALFYTYQHGRAIGQEYDLRRLRLQGHNSEERTQVPIFSFLQEPPALDLSVQELFMAKLYLFNARIPGPDSCIRRGIPIIRPS